MESCNSHVGGLKVQERCDRSVSILRGNLTVIVSVGLSKYDLSHFPNIISTILSFSKLLPENPRIHADS